MSEALMHQRDLEAGSSHCWREKAKHARNEEACERAQENYLANFTQCQASLQQKGKDLTAADDHLQRVKDAFRKCQVTFCPN